MPSHAVVVVNRLLGGDCVAIARDCGVHLWESKVWWFEVKGIAPKPLCSDTRVKIGVCARKEMSTTLRMLFKIELKWGGCGLVVSTVNR